VQLISEFSRSDLMLARRGFLGTSLAVAAGPELVEPMQRWLAPPAPGDLDDDPAADDPPGAVGAPYGHPGRPALPAPAGPRDPAPGARAADAGRAARGAYGAAGGDARDADAFAAPAAAARPVIPAARCAAGESGATGAGAGLGRPEHVPGDAPGGRPGLDGAPLDGMPRPDGAPRPEGVSETELELLETTTALFRRWDSQCGGGLRRKAVVGQLHEVTDLLQGTRHPAPVTRRLYRITADLAALAGWMSYDIGLQPTAQKYFVLALHAAREAADRPLGAFVLSSMSRQMMHLGRPEDALELIHLAQYGSRGTATATTQAMLHALEARAHANLGNVTRCHRAVKTAEDTFADAARAEDPVWMAFFTEAELAAEKAHSYRDLAYVAGRSPTYAGLAEEPMARAVELSALDTVHQRAYALNLVGMASVHLLRQRPEEAAALTTRAVEAARSVRSERVNTRIRKTARAALREFGDVPEVAELTEVLAERLPEIAGPA
jgi:hypothetical protein